MISPEDVPNEARRVSDSSFSYVLLTPLEVAQMMRRSKEWVYDALRAGELPGKKILGSWFIPKHDLILFMSDRLPRRPGS